MLPQEITQKLDVISRQYPLKAEDYAVVQEAIKYIRNAEERHAISRPNPLFPESYDNIYED